MGTTLKNCKWYFILLNSVLLVGIILLLNYGKSVSFITLNAYHPFLLNVFFINFTFVGDGIFALCLISIYLFYFKKKKEGIAYLYAFLFSGIVVQIIKNLVDAPRPRLFFEAGQYLHFIDGVSLANYSSFPSGHTATAFAIATVFILFHQGIYSQLFVLLTAILVGYSRIYLAQHFLLDVMIGAVIGSVTGLIAFILVKHSKRIGKSIKTMHQFSPQQMSAPSSIQPV